MLLLPYLIMYYIVCVCFCCCMYYIVFVYQVFLCPSMAIDVSVQYNGGLLLDIILLTQCYYHWGTRFMP